MDSATTENEASTAPVDAFDEARVTTIARTIARTELERAERALSEASGRGGAAVGPHAGIRTLGELLSRGFDAKKGDAVLDWRDLVATRAIANQLIADSPGVHTPGVQGEVRGIVAPRRPAVTAWGTSDPGGSGLTVSWPYTAVDIKTLVGVQSAEKAEILSLKVPILRGTATLASYAGGSDLSYQAIKRSDPSYVEAYTRIMLGAWAYTTDNAFVDAVAAAATGTGALTVGPPWTKSGRRSSRPRWRWRRPRARLPRSHSRPRTCSCTRVRSCTAGPCSTSQAPRRRPRWT